MHHLPANLKRLRELRGWTQETTAEKLEVKRTNYSSYERGATEPKLDTLVKMQEVFNVGMDVLVGAMLGGMDTLTLRTVLSVCPPRRQATVAAEVE